MAFRDYLRGEVAQDFADGLISRREAVRRLGLMGVGAGGAAALLASCGDDGSPTAGTGTSTAAASGTAVAAGTLPPGGGTKPGEPVRFAGPAGELQGAYAAPAGDPRAGVLVVHENRGLTPHFHDLVGRFAGVGYAALAVDLLSSQGGTASLADPAAAPTVLSQAPADRLLADLRAGLDELARRAPGVDLGTVGFCFGGGMVWSLLQAGEDRIGAAAPFYGPVPDPADFSRASAAVLGVFAERDDRVNAGRDRARAALEAAGLPFEILTVPGTEHAFFNDTGQRYDAAGAAQAWTALLDWFDQYLG